MAAAAEMTYICIDNSFWMAFHPVFMAQIKAIKEYCHIKLKCNPESRVALFRMASYHYNNHHYGEVLSPTRDLQKILPCLEDIKYDCEGQVDFSSVLLDTGAALRFCPPIMKRRLLVFVGSPIHLHVTQVKPLGNILKEREIALDVVNFFVKGDRSGEDRSESYEKYRYAREELRELVAFVNDKDNTNSHMVDVDVSSVCDILSKSILKKNIRYLRKKDERKAKKNVNVKQEPELSRSEKNRTVSK